jgi:hypothetical protein
MRWNRPTLIGKKISFWNEAAVDYFKLLRHSFFYHVMEQRENQVPQSQETLVRLKNRLTW